MEHLKELVRKILGAPWTALVLTVIEKAAVHAVLNAIVNVFCEGG